MSEVLRLLNIKKNQLPIIKQVQLSECGHVCIAMISHYHGHALTLQALRELEEPAINGSNFLDLIRILERLKFNTRAIRLDIMDLHQVQCPAIIHWNMNHFVVLKSVHSNHAIIHDPAFGKRKIPLSELSKSFTGLVLEVEKAAHFKPMMSSKPLKIMDLFKRIQGMKNSLLILLILSLTIESFILLNPIFLQYITDQVVSSNNLNNLYTIALAFVLLTLFHTTTEYMRSHYLVYLTNHMSEYFSSAVMNHLLRLPFEYFEKRHKGDILSRFYSINEIQNKMTTDSINTLLDGLVIVLAVMIMAVFNVQLTCLVVLSLTCGFTLRIFSYNHLKNQSEISIVEMANLNSKFLEIIQSMMPIKLYSKEATMYREWKNYFIKGMNANIKIARVNILYNTANLFIFNMEHILVITLGALLVIKKQHSIGMLMAFLAYRQTLVCKTTSFIQKVFEYKLISIQMDRVADILLHPAESEEKDSVLKVQVQGDIKIQNLSYKYPGVNQCVLNNVHFHIKKGEKIAITGTSGVGKSTLLKIMLGLITPTAGRILIDDLPLNLLGIQKYRSLCASVMQDDSLISGSIIDNITFMDNAIDIHRVHQAAQMAQIHEDILQMTMGYESRIGDMGSSLSGGQKQRILLARALYKKPKLLFLDEATSHLDAATEVKINQALKELEITQVVIAHREESIKMADRVFVLEAGSLK